jgi:2,3-bisphosphoglycerate-dependent phosphoglycerate mutase
VPGILHFIRHGETDWNLERRLQGISDIPLNATGRAQALAVGAKLAAVPLDAVIASDLGRALDTAAAIAEPHGLTVAVDPRLRERSFGLIEGIPRDDLERQYGDELQAYWTDPDRAFEAGESRRQVQDRIAGFIRDLLAREPADEIALVSHGGTIASALHWLERRSLDEYEISIIANCSVTTVVITDPDAGDGIPEVESIVYDAGGEAQAAAR